MHTRSDAWGTFLKILGWQFKYKKALFNARSVFPLFWESRSIHLLPHSFKDPGGQACFRGEELGRRLLEPTTRLFFQVYATAFSISVVQGLWKSLNLPSPASLLGLFNFGSFLCKYLGVLKRCQHHCGCGIQVEMWPERGRLRNGGLEEIVGEGVVGKARGPGRADPLSD